MPKCWLHLPVGYHGRSSSIVVSGTPIKRPQGALPSAGAPTYGPCRALDYELEMAAILGGRPNKLGDRLTTDDVEENVFGIVIMNDWSARDIQGYEMVPLGELLPVLTRHTADHRLRTLHWQERALHLKVCVQEC